jgi:hypothetical protein
VLLHERKINKLLRAIVNSTTRPGGHPRSRQNWIEYVVKISVHKVYLWTAELGGV